MPVRRTPAPCGRRAWTPLRPYGTNKLGRRMDPREARTASAGMAWTLDAPTTNGVERRGIDEPGLYGVASRRPPPPLFQRTGA